MKALTHEHLRQYSYFASLSDESLCTLARKVQAVELNAGAKIITEGIPTDAFFFIVHGTVEIIRNKPEAVKTVLSVSRCGEGIGEMVMLTCSHRNSSAVAKTDVLLLRLSKQDFGDIILAQSACFNRPDDKPDICSLYAKMKMFTPFARLEPDRIYAVMDKLIEKEYGPGENIITQGDKGDYYYIIKSGRVAVLKQRQDGQELLLAELSEGSAFGEEALIRDLPRNATIRTLEKTTVLALNKNDFDRILASTYIKNVFPEDLVDAYERNDRIVILDSRIPPEFEEEHIKGAINIPVEWLRDKLKELDPEKEYFTYCTNDSRGMVAAYLMAINGFKARIIRGGLSAWPGAVSFGSEGIHWPQNTER